MFFVCAAFLNAGCSDAVPTIGFLTNSPGNNSLQNSASSSKFNIGAQASTVTSVSGVTYSTNVTISNKESLSSTASPGNYTVSPIEVSYE